MSLCIIPARGGSRRIPRKNIREFHGKPIIAYSILAAREARFDKVVVSTDDEDIASVAKMFGAEVHWRRPDMAKDEVGTQAVMQHVLQDLKPEESEIACCLYPCAPMVRSVWLQQAMWVNICSVGYVVAVAPEPLRDIGNFYIGCAGWFMNATPLYNLHTRLYVIPEDQAIDINDESDWVRAEAMFAKRRVDEQT